MANFIRAANPIWWIPDLTGFPLNDEYYAFFLTNTLPYVFQPVYQDPNGNNPWAAPLQFQPAGTLPNNLYFNELEVYRIEIRHGNTSQDPLIYLIEDFVPGNNVNTSNTALLTAENMITNPQFADVYFVAPPGQTNPTFTYTQAMGGTYSVNIGPGWRLVLEGSGSVTLTQFALDGIASTNIVGDPNYYLRLNGITGWTSVKLVQRFNNNGAIYTSGAIAIAFTAAASGSSFQMQVLYHPSTGPAVPIFDAPIQVGALSEYKNAIDLDHSMNSDLDGSAFVDIEFVIPANSGSDLSITNVQIVGQSVNLPANFNVATDIPSYQQQTYERTVDQEFNNYKSWLFNKRIPSALVGWDFPLNPAQIFGNFGAVPAQPVGANKSYYAWDQTILFQSADSGITVSSPASGDLTLTAAVTTQMAVIQYLDTTETRKLLASRMSVNIAATSTTASTNGIVCTCSLWYTTDATLPNINSTGGTPPNSSSLVATLSTNGKPNSFNGTWVEVPRLIQQDAIFTVESADSTRPSEYHDYNFNDWDLQGIAAVNTATYFAIVIGTASITAADSLHIHSIGLMPGDIATRPAPQTADEVLRECQYYYEKSYEIDIPVGATTNNGIIHQSCSLLRSGGNDHLSVKNFSYIFKNKKRTIASPQFSLTFWAPDGTLGAVNLNIHRGSDNTFVVGNNIGIVGNWSQYSLTTSGFLYLQGSASSISNPQDDTLDGSIFYHYLADCRLGI